MQARSGLMKEKCTRGYMRSQNCREQIPSPTKTQHNLEHSHHQLATSQLPSHNVGNHDQPLSHNSRHCSQTFSQKLCRKAPRPTNRQTAPSLTKSRPTIPKNTTNHSLTAYNITTNHSLIAVRFLSSLASFYLQLSTYTRLCTVFSFLSIVRRKAFTSPCIVDTQMNFCT